MPISKSIQVTACKNIAQYLVFTALVVVANIPACLSQWQFLRSPETGKPLNFDAEGNRFFACTRSDLFYSTDSIDSWNVIPTPDDAIFLNSVEIENGHLYLQASDESSYANLTLLFRSDNFGNSWKKIWSSSENYHYILSSGDTLLLVLRRDSIAVSFDAGESFLFKKTPEQHRLLVHHNILMTLGLDKILFSKDWGTSWDSIMINTIDSQPVELKSIGNVLLRTDINVNMADTHFSRSYDDGKSWETVYTYYYFAEAPGLTISLSTEHIKKQFNLKIGFDYHSRKLPR
jgi:hypothetical protein